MKVVAYNIKDYEKELLALANGKMHDLTLISNAFNMSTIHYAVGKEVVVISRSDILDFPMLLELKKIGISKVITRSIDVNHINLAVAQQLQIKVANTPSEDQSVSSIAQQTIRNLNLWEEGKSMGKACRCTGGCADEFKNK